VRIARGTAHLTVCLSVRLAPAAAAAAAAAASSHVH